LLRRREPGLVPAQLRRLSCAVRRLWRQALRRSDADLQLLAEQPRARARLQPGDAPGAAATRPGAARLVALADGVRPRRRARAVRLVHPPGTPSPAGRRALGPSPRVLLCRARLLWRAARASPSAVLTGPAARPARRGPSRRSGSGSQ